LPEDISLRLTDSLYKDGLIPQGVRVHTIVKTYFYDEPFNLLIFRDTEGNLLGHYSDIGEPVKKLGEGEYAMLDLFLDIWLMPDGTLLELDWDEFAEAVEQNLVTPAQAELARATLERLKIEIASGIYPRRYLLPG
jgi:predicted RNA-binding protein associated with RNAse of E/G family